MCPRSYFVEGIMDVKYRQLCDYNDYFVSKPDGDAAIDLRIVDLDRVSFATSGNEYSISGHTGVRILGEGATMVPQSESTSSVAKGGGKYAFVSGNVYNIRTGMSLEVPAGHVGFLSLRSSFGRSGFIMLNSPGVIDPGFRGEIQASVALIVPVTTVFVPRWSRVLQLTIVPCVKANLVQVSELTDTERGQGGFGSTGVV